MSDHEERAAARRRHPSTRHVAAHASPGPIAPSEAHRPLSALLGAPTAAAWADARTAWEAGEATARELARRLDVAPSTVTRRRTRERWAPPAVVELHPPAQRPAPTDRATEHPVGPNPGELDELRARWEAARARIAARDALAVDTAYRPPPGPLLAAW